MIKNKDIEVYVDTSGLPKRGGRIDWMNSVGYSIPFKYDCVTGYVNIVEYKKKGRICITIKNYADEPVEISPNSVIHGYFALLLANKIVDKFPEMIQYLANKRDAYKYSYQSNEKVKCKCPFCGKESEQYPGNIYKRGFYCECFADGVSLPNKLMSNILTQLNIPYKREVGETVFSWIGEYYYDFYFQIGKNQNVLVEMDGRYHEKDDCKARDEIKNRLAKENRFRLIRIDCAYKGDPIQYIKHNILNSELKDILDLKSIDWNQCKEVYKNQPMLKACEMWEDTLCTISNIAQSLQMDNYTIAKYLKRGVSLGICSYSYAEAHSRRSSRQVAIIDEDSVLRAFFNAKECATTLQSETGMRFTAKGVSNCAYGYNKSYRGYRFKHITKEEYEQYKMIEKNKNIEVVLEKGDDLEND